MIKKNIFIFLFHRVFQAIKIKDEDELKFFIDIFINLCDTNLEAIISENRVDLLKIIVDLSRNTPSDSKV